MVGGKMLVQIVKQLIEVQVFLVVGYWVQDLLCLIVVVMGRDDQVVGDDVGGFVVEIFMYQMQIKVDFCCVVGGSYQ